MAGIAVTSGTGRRQTFTGTIREDLFVHNFHQFKDALEKNGFKITKPEPQTGGSEDLLSIAYRGLLESTASMKFDGNGGFNARVDVTIHHNPYHDNAGKFTDRWFVFAYFRSEDNAATALKRLLNDPRVRLKHPPGELFLKLTGSHDTGVDVERLVDCGTEVAAAILECRRLVPVAELPDLANALLMYHELEVLKERNEALGQGSKVRIALERHLGLAIRELAPLLSRAEAIRSMAAANPVFVDAMNYLAWDNSG